MLRIKQTATLPIGGCFRLERRDAGIEKNNKGSESTLFPFTGKSTFESKEDAIKHCFLAGKHIIDNEPGKLVK